jgi:hypothetical protein
LILAVAQRNKRVLLNEESVSTIHAMLVSADHTECDRNSRKRPPVSVELPVKIVTQAAVDSVRAKGGVFSGTVAGRARRGLRQSPVPARSGRSWNFSTGCVIGRPRQFLAAR